MKTTVKSLVLAFFLVGLSQVAFAQKAATAPASAEILQDLVITLDGTLNAINFGRVSSTTPGIIRLDPNSDAANINTGSVTNVARFNLAGANGGATVFYDATVSLQSGSQTMIMTPLVVGDAAQINRASAAAIASGSTVTLASNAYFIWVGGTIPQLAAQAVGTYVGTFNISVEYN
jgi:hypothetical protein